ERRERDATKEARHVEKRIGPQSDEPEAGNRNRAVGGARQGRQGPAKADWNNEKGRQEALTLLDEVPPKARRRRSRPLGRAMKLLTIIVVLALIAPAALAQP